MEALALKAPLCELAKQLYTPALLDVAVSMVRIDL